jgi:membrane protease YdiL (CAAX protease family)
MSVVQFPKPVKPLPSQQGREVGALRVVPSSDARLSLRVVTMLEMVSVLGSVLIAAWALLPMYPQARWPIAVPAALALWLIVRSQFLRGETWAEVGFHREGFFAACKLLTLPMLLGIAVMCAIGWWMNSFQRSTHFAVNLIIAPLWGVLQQYITQGFLYRRVRWLMVQRNAVDEAKQLRLAILLSAGCFALVHLPNPTLTVLTFAAGLLWTWVYERVPNLWALGLSHGLLSFVMMHTLPTWLLQSMSIGYKHFLYQKF